MMMRHAFFIAMGASLGALLRWLLGMTLNSLFPTLPPGTLMANLLGGLLMGMAMSFFAQSPHLDPQWRLFITTGFLGGLTTFSTFSAEVTTLLQTGRPGWAGLAIAIHVTGSLLMTALGIVFYSLLRTL